MVRLFVGLGAIFWLLHAAPAAAVVVVDTLSVRPNPVHFTRDNPAELEFEVAIRDRGMTRILGCQLALDFGDGTPDLLRHFMDGGPRKSSVKHVYRKPGIYNVRVHGVLGNKAATVPALRPGSLRFGPIQVRQVLGAPLFVEFDENKHPAFGSFTSVTVEG